ncbi:unnamed protein product, partial [Adineta steineri]
MNNTLAVFQEISSLISLNSLFNKSIEIYDTIISLDQTIFTHLENQLFKLTIEDNEIFLSENDYLSSLLLFLLEHIPVEINLNLLTSTETDYHQIT